MTSPKACIKCKEREKNWYQNNRERKLDYHYNNRERILEYQQEYYLANTDRAIARNAHWRRNSPELYRAQRRRRRARERGAAVEVFTRDALLKHWISHGINPDSCIYCGGPHQHDDHVIPLARGGTHERANLVPSCQPCNNSKGAKLLEEWRPERFAA